MKMFNKNNLDERQEQALLKIEHNGCWLAFWGLFIVLVAEYIAFGYEDLRSVAGEWVIFMILAIYLSVDCTKHGIWDRRIKMNMFSIIMSSLIGGILAAAIGGIVNYKTSSGDIGVSVITAVVFFVLTFVAIFVCLLHDAKKITKHNEEMDKKYNDEEE